MTINKKTRAMKAKDHKIWALPYPSSINKMINFLLKMMCCDIFLRMVKYIPWSQGMCNEVVHIEPRSLTFIPDQFKTQEICDKAVEVEQYMLKVVPVHLRMGEMSNKKYLNPMKDVPGHLKTQEIHNKEVKKDP